MSFPAHESRDDASGMLGSRQWLAWVFARMIPNRSFPLRCVAVTIAVAIGAP